MPPPNGGLVTRAAFCNMRPMTNKPLYPSTTSLLLRPKQTPSNPQPRATLEGLEVQESSFGQWLAAGGERRSLARPEGDKPR
jgi:hypothetical protein